MKLEIEANQKLLIASVIVSILLLLTGFPQKHLTAKSFKRGIPDFPSEIRQIESISSDAGNDPVINFPEEYRDYQVFIGKELENLALKIKAANLFVRLAVSDEKTRFSENEKVFLIRTTKKEKYPLYFVLKISGHLHLLNSRNNKSLLLARFSKQYFEDTSLFKEFADNIKQLVQIAEDKERLLFNLQIYQKFFPDAQTATLVFYKNTVRKGKISSKEAFYKATELLFIKNADKRDQADKKQSTVSYESQNGKDPATQKPAAKRTKALTLSSQTQNNISVSNSSSSSTCSCDMKLLFDGIEIGQPQTESEILALATILEGKKSKHKFTFYDANYCFEPKLESLSLSDEGVNEPWKNHAGERKLKFSSDINWTRSAATLTAIEALWYGVRKNSTENICADHVDQSLYKVTFDATFDIAECNKKDSDYFYVAAQSVNASSNQKYKLIKSPGILKESYIKLTPNKQCCVDYNSNWNPHPIKCTAKEQYPNSDEEYGQFLPKIKAEEEFHSRQACDPSVPFSKGGMYGQGGPLNPQTILSSMPTPGACVDIPQTGGWFSTPESRLKKACASAKKQALNNLHRKLAENFIKANDDSYTAWVEWTAKKEIGVTEFERTAYHYACAYGRSPKFPDNNPPQPDF